MDDELELGLPPSTKVAREPKVTDDIRWTPYKVNDRRFCEDCMAEMPTVGGVPVRAVNRAFYQRKQGATVGYFCYKHHEDRLIEEAK